MALPPFEPPTGRLSAGVDGRWDRPQVVLAYRRARGSAAAGDFLRRFDEECWRTTSWSRIVPRVTSRSRTWQSCFGADPAILGRRLVKRPVAMRRFATPFSASFRIVSRRLLSSTMDLLVERVELCLGLTQGCV